MPIITFFITIQVTAGTVFTGIEGSNPTGGMDVCQPFLAYFPYVEKMKGGL
jgi:hypothetical protein